MGHKLWLLLSLGTVTPTNVFCATERFVPTNTYKAQLMRVPSIIALPSGMAAEPSLKL